MTNKFKLLTAAILISSVASAQINPFGLPPAPVVTTKECSLTRMDSYGIPAIILCMRKGLIRTAKHLIPGKKVRKWELSRYTIKMEDFILTSQHGRNRSLNISNEIKGKS